MSSLNPIAAKSWDKWKAAHLFNRAGFGSTDQESQQFTEMGFHQAVNQLVHWNKTKEKFDHPEWAEPENNFFQKRRELQKFFRGRRSKEKAGSCPGTPPKRAEPPSLVAGTHAHHHASSLRKDHLILVILQMEGGNDGLNTIIPYADDLKFNVDFRSVYAIGFALMTVRF